MKGNITFHLDRLIAALNKYYRPITMTEYYDRMDIPSTNNAVAVAGFPKEVEDWIWEKEYQAFEVYS